MYIAIDIGGTKTIVSGFSEVDPSQLVFSSMFSTDRNFDNHIKKIREVIKNNLNDQKIEGIGISHVGILDKNKEKCIDSNNLAEFVNKPIKKLIAKDFTDNVRLENDLVCGALAEATFGYGMNYDKVLYFTVSTGIGAAFAYKIGNNINVVQIEAGFFSIKGIGLPHPSGQVDIIESYVGEKSMEERFLKRPEEIQDLLLWEKQVGYLSTAVINSLIMFNTDVLVLGGGMIENNEYLREKLIINIESGMMQKKLPTIKVSKMGKSVAVNGALSLLKK
ncbi:MAG: ROK family protein [Candidatus Dojkabacteria bacterium]|nr:ROK family protein [Candidatus Dojkabacteria bacterium]MDQ7020698.1 ROK family protein [Candidatus Dojkabacteria bacterium]